MRTVQILRNTPRNGINTMKTYLISWSIELDADSARAAALAALAIQRDTASIATVFHVIEQSDLAWLGPVEEIDLSSTLQTLAATLRTQGGFTYNVTEDSLVTSGYAVSPYKSFERRYSGHATQAQIIGYTKEHKEMLALSQHFLGA